MQQVWLIAQSKEETWKMTLRTLTWFLLMQAINQNWQHSMWVCSWSFNTVVFWPNSSHGGSLVNHAHIFLYTCMSTNEAFKTSWLSWVFRAGEHTKCQLSAPWEMLFQFCFVLFFFIINGHGPSQVQVNHLLRSFLDQCSAIHKGNEIFICVLNYSAGS